MAITAEQINGIRRRVQTLNDRRAEAEAQQRVAEQELARLAAEAEEQFGVGTLDGLEALLATEEATLDAKVAELEEALREAEARVAELPQ